MRKINLCKKSSYYYDFTSIYLPKKIYCPRNCKRFSLLSSALMSSRAWSKPTPTCWGGTLGIELSVLHHSPRLVKIIWNFSHLFISLPPSSDIFDGFESGEFIIYWEHTAHIAPQWRDTSMWCQEWPQRSCLFSLITSCWILQRCLPSVHTMTPWGALYRYSW